MKEIDIKLRAQRHSEREFVFITVLSYFNLFIHIVIKVLSLSTFCLLFTMNFLSRALVAKVILRGNTSA